MMWPHRQAGPTVSNTNNTVKFEDAHTAIQTYALHVQGQHDTRSIQSTNADQCRTVINIIIVYSEGKMAHEGEITASYCTERQ